jgi:hypothetical protein
MSKSYLPVLIWRLDVYWRNWFPKKLKDLQVPNLIVGRTDLRSTINSGIQIQKTFKNRYLLICQPFKALSTISSLAIISLLES